jgi:hypothetical protein
VGQWAVRWDSEGSGQVGPWGSGGVIGKVRWATIYSYWEVTSRDVTKLRARVILLPGCDFQRAIRILILEKTKTSSL